MRKIKALAVVLLTAALLNCGAKKPAKLPLREQAVIRFEGVHDGKCIVAAIMVDAKPNRYTVVCKAEK